MTSERDDYFIVRLKRIKQNGETVTIILNVGDRVTGTVTYVDGQGGFCIRRADGTKIKSWVDSISHIDTKVAETEQEKPAPERRKGGEAKAAAV